jgi:hypothetical protein
MQSSQRTDEAGSLSVLMIVIPEKTAGTRRGGSLWVRTAGHVESGVAVIAAGAQLPWWV